MDDRPKADQRVGGCSASVEKLLALRLVGLTAIEFDPFRRFEFELEP